MDENGLIGEENSIDSEDEARRHDYGLYLMKRLIQIKKAQNNRLRLETLLRAFYRWSYEFPLAQKCDELAKQLRERNLMLDTVRSSYLRDVVSVKHHLDRINDAEADEENPSLVKLKQNMYDLHTLPSVDLRGLVENARASVRQSSAQLREGLVDAGLLDPETLRTLNPWDESRGYRRLMRIKKGGAAKPPDVEGESIALAAPSKKKLFVRYCKECIGLSMFIKDWNREVELSLKFKADFCNIDNLIQEYRSVIEKLNGTIEGQETEIVRLLERTSKLETANAWFEKWGVLKEAGRAGNGGIMDEYEQKMMYKHTSEMARAEIESFAFNSAMRLEVREKQHLAAEMTHRQRLREAELSKDADSKERVKLMQEFRKTQQDLQARVNEITELSQANSVKEAEKAHLNQKLAAAEADNKQLHSVIDKKEADYGTLRDESNTKIEDLNYQIRQLSSDYNNQENTIDELRDSVINKKVSACVCTIPSLIITVLTAVRASSQQTTIQDQANEISDLKQRVRELERLIPPPKPRFTLRVVATAVRYLMRLYRLLRQKDYESMGRLGYNELTRRQDKYIKMLTNANDKLQRQVFTLSNSFAFQGEELLSYRAVVKEKNVALKEQDTVKQELKRTLSLLRHTEAEKQEAIALGESNIEAQNVIINQRIHGALEVQHDHHLQQAKVYAQIQRNLGHHMAQSLFRVRAIVSAFDVDSELAVLAKPYEATFPNPVPDAGPPTSPKSQPAASFGSPSERSAPPTELLLSKQKSTRSLMLGLRTKSKALVSWVKKNRIKMVLMPKKVPVVLFRQPRPDDDRESLRRERAKSLKVMTHVIQQDFQHVEEVRKLVDADMRKLQDYVYALKNKHNELLLQVKILEEELREERMPSVNSRTNRKRIGDIKSSFSHLMRSTDASHQNSYFSNVLSAIETVQAEHGEMFKDKLIKSGKFKLTEVAKEVVKEVRRSSVTVSAKEANPTVNVWSRQNSAKSTKMGSSTKSMRLDTSSADNSPSRSSSFAAAGNPLARLPSVLEQDQEGNMGERPTGQVLRSTHSTRGMAASMKYGLNVPHAVPEHPEGPHHDEDGNSTRSEAAPLTIGNLSDGEHCEKGQDPHPVPRRLFADEEPPTNRTAVSASHAIGHAGANNAQEPRAAGTTDAPARRDSTPLRLPRTANAPAPAPAATANRKTPSATAPTAPADPRTVSFGNAADSDSDKIGFPSRDPSVLRFDLQYDGYGDSAPTVQRGTSAVHMRGAVARESPRAQTPGTHHAGSGEQMTGRVLSSEDLVPDQTGFALDAERSLCYDSETVGAAEPPAPPYSKTNAAELPELEGAEVVDTVGFESDEEEEGEEFDEDILYMEDLLAAQHEMQGLLTREEVIQNRIRQAEEDRVYLEQQVRSLEDRLEQKKAEYARLEQTVHVATGEQKQLKGEVKELTHQNELLKEIVEEDYRFHAANLDKVLKEKEQSVVDRFQRRITTAHQGTQVSCAVCAIKEEGLRGQVAPRVHSGYDDATVATVNEQFTKALNGEVILIAKPRRINKKTIRSNQTDSPDNVPSQPAHLKGFEELFANPPTKEELLLAARPILGGAFETLQPKQRQTQQRGPSPTPGTGFSELLMKHLESTQHDQPQVRICTAATATEGSKFSRIKKMPTKSSTSSGDLLPGGADKAALAQRPHSASLATLKRNAEHRTESHTAAYLQNKLMGGYGTTPQIAPVSSQPHVPLHTVDIACTIPEPTAAYLARAAQNKARASSASAARTEHTNSAKLLQGWQEQDAGSQHSHVTSHHTKPASANTAEQGPAQAFAAPPRPQSVDVRVRVPLPPRSGVTSSTNASKRDYLLDMADDLSDAGVEFV
jgi:L-lactate utilization protein LutC